MIKITLETDEEVVGIKDNHAWTKEDALHIFESVVKKSNLGVDEKAKIDFVTVYPNAPIQEAEGM